MALVYKRLELAFEGTIFNVSNSVSVSVEVIL
jgi:hypothetical protein